MVNTNTTHDVIYENDQWTLELEELGFKDTAVELARLILACTPPFAICVRGRWGSGKTSLMRYAMLRLGDQEDPVTVPFIGEVKENRNFIGADNDTTETIRKSGEDDLNKAHLFPQARCDTEESQNSPDEKPENKNTDRITSIWFSPWRYQNDPNPLVPLLHTLRNHFSLWAKTRTRLSKAARVAVDAGLDLLGYLLDGVFHTGAFSGLPTSIRHAREKFDEQQLAGLSDAERFNMLFEHAVDMLLGASLGEQKNKESKHRLVIFIDDLDRCEGEKAVHLLEAIKMHLSTKQCVFVLGIDQTALEHEVRGYWSGRPVAMAAEYLEKLFQVAVHVPVSRKYPGFIHARLRKKKLLPPEEDIESVGKTAEAIASILEPNPRKVKNFLNSLFVAIEERSFDTQEKSFPSDLLRFALVQRLKLTAPNTYRLLAQGRQEQCETLSTFFNTASLEGIQDPGMFSIGIRDYTVYCADFGHLIRPDESRELPLDRADLLVRLDRIHADFKLARLWTHTDGMASIDDFERVSGISMERAPISGENSPSNGKDTEGEE